MDLAAGASRFGRRAAVLLPVLGLIAITLCGLALFGLGTAHVGLAPLLIGVAAALAPVGLVVAGFLWVDRWEPEPARLLLLAFAFGACVAALSALLINSTAREVGSVLLGADGGATFGILVSAPLVEEAAKAAFVLAVMWRRSREFDGVIDGIVYAGFAAAGFAFSENVYYFGRAFAANGFAAETGTGVLATFVLRGILSPFTHPLFSVLAGIGIGVAVQSRSRLPRIVAPLAGYCGAVVLHAAWNASATLGTGEDFLNIYFLVMVPIFVAVLLFVMWHRRREQRIIASALPGMAAANLIASSEIALLASLSGRRQWRRQVVAQSGRRAAKAVGAYQATVTELAFLRRNLALGVAGRHAEAHQAQLLATLRDSRAEAVRLAGSRSG